MKRNGQQEEGTFDSRIEEAKARIKAAEARIEQARTRAELAETRTELAETRTELAKTCTEQAEIRAEQAEIRAEQAETILQRVIHKEIDICAENGPLKQLPLIGTVEPAELLERLTSRQREILQLIAEGQNTKQIGDALSISPKTVEYHRARLMAALDVHDVPGLVRLAVGTGLVPAEAYV